MQFVPGSGTCKTDYSSSIQEIGSPKHNAFICSGQRLPIGPTSKPSCAYRLPKPDCAERKRPHAV